MRLMVLDSSSVVRKVAKRILAGPDTLISEAGTGDEALEMCRIEMPDQIICDQMLADMSAIDFITAVNEIEGGRKPRIFINLHEMDLVAIMRAKRAGATGFILKPFNRAILLERFRDLNQAA